MGSSDDLIKQLREALKTQNEAKVALLEANLREPTVTPLAWDDERLEQIREALRLSIRSMRAYLVDPAANTARVDDFERTEELRICRWCNFKAVCRPEVV